MCLTVADLGFFWVRGHNIHRRAKCLSNIVQDLYSCWTFLFGSLAPLVFRHRTASTYNLIIALGQRTDEWQDRGTSVAPPLEPPLVPEPKPSYDTQKKPSRCVFTCSCVAFHLSVLLHLQWACAVVQQPTSNRSICWIISCMSAAAHAHTGLHLLLLTSPQRRPAPVAWNTQHWLYIYISPL